MTTFSVKNFEQFQHYKDRSPPWIKLYNELLDDYEFGLLPDASKLHLILIWLLASRSANKLPFDEAWIGRRINASEPVNLRLLARHGFIIVDGEIPQENQTLRNSEQIASKALQTSEQGAIPEREGETETEQREREREIAPSALVAGATPDDLSTAFDLWNELAERLGLPTVQARDVDRKRLLKARLKDCGGIEGWRAALEKVEGSGFLRGTVPRGKGHENWRCDFDFIVSPKKFRKLMEGGYDDNDNQVPQSGFLALSAELKRRTRGGDIGHGEPELRE